MPDVMYHRGEAVQLHGRYTSSALDRNGVPCPKREWTMVTDMEGGKLRPEWIDELESGPPTEKED